MYSRHRYAKRKLALLIPAHNEDVVIVDTINSAMAAGQPADDIYVISDGSVDRTVELATALLGADHVIDQPQGGKARAILNGIKTFEIEDRYYWMHIADADGVFSVTYFAELHKRLDRRYAAATGYIQSLPGGWISRYRTYEYTLGLEILRRIQAFLGVIAVIPGPTSIFRTDILKHLDFTVDSLTEDMDITLQIHRQKLGRIAYIPQAKTYTQDPANLHDYMNQISRWYRGNFQVMARHRVGLHPQRVDAFISFVMLEQFVLVGQLIVFPFWAYWSQSYAPIAILFLNDLVVFLGLTICAAGLNRRADVLGAFPMFYILRFVSLFVFVRSWFEVVVLRKFRSVAPGWSVAGRRYRIATGAVAK